MSENTYRAKAAAYFAALGPSKTPGPFARDPYVADPYHGVTDPPRAGVTGTVALAAQEANKPENIEATQKKVQNAAIASADAHVRKSSL